MNRKFKLIRVLKIALMITLMVGFGTMYLWNWLVPLLFHGPVVTFLQALGLLVLSKILFGSFGRGRRGFSGRRRWQRRMQERFANMTPEEKEKFSQQMQGRCGAKFSGFEETRPVTE